MLDSFTIGHIFNWMFYYLIHTKLSAGHACLGHYSESIVYRTDGETMQGCEDCLSIVIVSFINCVVRKGAV